MMGTCPVDGCDNETIQVMDPRCTVCIHKGREYTPDPEKKESQTDQGSLAAFAVGEEVRTE